MSLVDHIDCVVCLYIIVGLNINTIQSMKSLDLVM